MYKLLGADQKEYGPVSGEQVRQWIAQGRANAQTKVQPAGSTAWQPLAQCPEFADALGAGAPPPPRPPVPGVIAPVGVAAPAPASGLAISSLVLGILGLFTCGFTAVIGLVLGIVALVRIDRSKGQLGGKGMAVAGMIVSGAFLLLLPFLAAMFIPALAHAKQRALTIHCLSNVRQLDLALAMYADANVQFPAGDKWCDAVRQNVGRSSVFLCPEGKPGARSHYAFNAKLSGVSPKALAQPSRTVLLFETDGGWNLSGGKELLPAKPRHGTYVIGFVDGHAEAVRPESLNKLRWAP